MIRVTLDYPDKRLSQNARIHWAVRSKITKAARQEAHWTVKYEAERAGVSLDQLPRPVPIQVFVFPPDRRRRDLQNVIGALKASMDGVSDALGVDDAFFAIRWPEQFSAPVKNGAVIITIGEG